MLEVYHGKFGRKQNYCNSYVFISGGFSEWSDGVAEECGKIQFLAKEVEPGSKKKPDTMIMAWDSELPAYLALKSELSPSHGAFSTSKASSFVGEGQPRNQATVDLNAFKHEDEFVPGFLVGWLSLSP